MRLIFGLYRFDGERLAESQLRAMASAMIQPPLAPAVAVWCDGTAGLGIIDFTKPSTEPLSLFHDDGGVLAADLRIDAPQVRDAPAHLAGLLRQSGLSPLAGIYGDFAFAYFRPADRRLILGRDTQGVRPLHYTIQPGRFIAFASLASGLHSSGVISRRIDEAAVLRHYLWHADFEMCRVQGIKRLPPGHGLVAGPDGITKLRYWQLDTAKAGTARIGAAEAAEELRRQFEAAVHCRIPPDGKVGVQLSGGLDSSAIAVLVSRQLRRDGRRLQAYALLDRPREDIKFEDESAYVRAVLEFEPDILLMPVGPAAGLPKDVRIDIDHGTQVQSDQPIMAMDRHARDHGIGVMFSGWGGDEAVTFHGDGAYAELLQKGRWRILNQALAERRAVDGVTLSRLIRREILPYFAIGRFYRGLKGKFSPRTIEDHFLPFLTPRARVLAKQGVSSSAVVLRPDTVANRLQTLTSPRHVLRNEFEAWEAAHFGLEMRYPMQDRRLIEFALSLPAERFVDGGRRRGVFRAAMKGVLPDKVRLRTSKFVPFPAAPMEVSEGRQILLDRIAFYRSVPAVQRCIDIERVTAAAEALPEPDEIRARFQKAENHAARIEELTFLRAVQLAAYLAQHEGEETARPNASAEVVDGAV